MGPQEFHDAVRRGMATSGCDMDQAGFSMVLGGDGCWRIQRDRSIYENDFISLGTPRSGLDESAVRGMLERLRDWYKGYRRTQALVAAHDWLYKPRDRVDRPYLADAVVLRHFERAGMDRDRLADAMRHQIGPRPGVRDIVQRLGYVYTSFTRDNAPAAFEQRRWKSGTRLLRPGLEAVGPIQFQLVGGGGSGIDAYFEIAPGAFWSGGPSPELWLADQQIPHTLMTGSKGRHVTDVIGHPTLEVEGLTIRSIVRERGRVSVKLKSVRERLHRSSHQDGID